MVVHLPNSSLTASGNEEQQLAPETSAVSRIDRWFIPLIGLTLLGLVSHGTFAGSGDEPHYLAIAHSVAFDHDIDLSNNYGAREPLIGGGTLMAEAHARTGAGGITRPVHDIGMPVLFAPYVRVTRPLTDWLAETVPSGAFQRAKLTPAVLYRHLISLAMIALACVLARSLRSACDLAGVPRTPSRWAIALICLSPPLLVFSILFFTELLSALLVTMAVTAIMLHPAPRTREGVIAGASAALLPLVHVRNAPLAACIAIMSVWVLRDQRARSGLIACAVLVAFGAAARLLVTHAFWGTWITTPHASLGDWPGLTSVVAEMGQRLAGLLVDREYGLLPYFPSLVLAVWGIIPLVQRQPLYAKAMAAALTTYLVFVLSPVTNTHGWTGGWSPPARFLVPVLPFAVVPLAFGLSRAPRGLVALMVAAQILINAYIWQHPKLLWNDGDGRAAWCDITGEALCGLVPSLVALSNQLTPAANSNTE